jgi:hypothetical protein
VLSRMDGDMFWRFNSGTHGCASPHCGDDTANVAFNDAVR